MSIYSIFCMPPLITNLFTQLTMMLIISILLLTLPLKNPIEWQEYGVNHNKTRPA